MAERGSTPIIGFYHICMINHYMDIVKIQIKELIKSGLYDQVKSIYIGCVGNKQELKKLEIELNGFDKLQIVDYDENTERFEYITLKILHGQCLKNKKFYGFYIHTKGCSYPGNQGGKIWLDYMDYYNLSKWKNAIHHLDLGYDTYGVKLISKRQAPAFRMHYSGNFFWFNSEYAKTLVNIDSLCQTNRGNAEMWICSNYPIAATACQDFIDYNTTNYKIDESIHHNV